MSARIIPQGPLEATVNDHGPSFRRSARSVLYSHLHCIMIGDLDGDLTDNYAAPVIVLTSEGVMCGHDGLRRLARTLRTYEARRRVQVWADVGCR